MIENTAAIYFDFNPPIFTNTFKHRVGNLFDNLPTKSHEFGREDMLVKIFPQPALDQAYFDIQGVPGQRVQLQVYDLSGRLLQEQSYENLQFTLDSGHLPTGLYIYSLRLADGRFWQGKFTVLGQ